MSIRVFIWACKLLMFCRNKKFDLLLMYFLCSCFFFMYDFFDFAIDPGWIPVITNNSFARYEITYYMHAYSDWHCLMLYCSQNYFLLIWWVQYWLPHKATHFFHTLFLLQINNNSIIWMLSVKQLTKSLDQPRKWVTQTVARTWQNIKPEIL